MSVTIQTSEALPPSPPLPRAEVATSAIGKITYEEFLEQADEDTYAEWIDGEVIKMSPASTKHQDVSDFLGAILRVFAEARNLGKVISAPFQMKTAKLLPGREPDLIFVARQNLSRLKSSYLDGPADLVIEIISPESRSRDRGDKFFEYEQGGVREYWLIDPQRKRAEFYQLGADGIYTSVNADADGKYHSLVLSGLQLRIDWFWQEPMLPPLLETLTELGLIS